MSSLNQYIAELNFFADNLHNVVGDAGVKNADYIVNKQNTRLENKGTDAKESPIGSYSSVTVSFKKSKGDRYDHVTLKDEGNWYNSMFVENRGTQGLIIDSSDTSLTGKLMNGGGERENPAYGKDIIGLTEPETNDLVIEKIDPEIQKTINKLPQTIDI